MQRKAFFCTGVEKEAVATLQRFRKGLFVDTCGWSLNVEEGREIDQFDTLEAVHAGVVINGELLGTFRATRTDRPYLAADVFPGLAVLKPYPRRADIWEISRFGVASAGGSSSGRLTYALMFLFARRIGVSALVAMADLAHERVLRAYGIRTQRYGPPQPVGTDAAGRTLQAVAGEIPIAAQNQAVVTALLSFLDDVEIEDASNVFGPRRVSA